MEAEITWPVPDGLYSIGCAIILLLQDDGAFFAVSLFADNIAKTLIGSECAGAVPQRSRFNCEKRTADNPLRN
jgi:hypothetical protein